MTEQLSNNKNSIHRVKKLAKHVSKFFIIGVLAVMIDFTVYYLLSVFLSVDISKVLGFISGSAFTYYFNKIWTWRHKEKTNRNMLIRFGVIYGVSLICNVLINKYMLALIPDYYFSATISDTQHVTHTIAAFKTDKMIAFFIATLFSAVFNFTGQKYWVFKSEKDSEIILSVEESD
jgi:putative flippase GtrA